MRKATLGVRRRVAALGLAGALWAALPVTAASSPRSFWRRTRRSAGERFGDRVCAQGFLRASRTMPPGRARPYRGANRATLEFNQGLNRSVVYPVAKAYREGVPDALRNSIEAFSNNLGEPLIFANDLLQLRPEAARTTLARFAMNSTFGLGPLRCGEPGKTAAPERGLRPDA